MSRRKQEKGYKKVSQKDQPDVELNPMIDVEQRVDEEAACYICPSGEVWQKRTIRITGNDKDRDGKLVIKDVEGGELSYEIRAVIFNESTATYPHGALELSYDDRLGLDGSNGLHMFKPSSAETGKTMRKMTSDFKNPNYGAIDKGERGPKKDKVARTKVTLSAEEEEAFQGIMWCGTIFVHDEDGNGDIDMDSTDEYQTMSEVADGVEEGSAEGGSEDGAGKLAKRVLKAHIFKSTKTNWKKLQKEQDLTFALVKQQVRIVVRYEPSVNLVIFSLAGVLTQISVMSDFHKALLTNGVLKQLSNQFKANAKKGKGLNILALANQQQRDNYNTEVSAEITKQNAINYDMLIKEKQIDANMKTIRAQIMQNMESIDERRVMIKRNLNLSKEVDKTMDVLGKKATKVAEISWWLKMKWYFICGFIATLIITGVVLFLYFYLK